MLNLDTHSIHITFESSLPSLVRAAVNNVFENFNFFLQFNKFKPSSKNLVIGTSNQSDLFVSQRFVQNLVQKNFDHMHWFEKQALIVENNSPDYIGTCFYMINCLQEFTNHHGDFLDRFTYEASYQYKFDCATSHLVLDYFQEMAKQIFGQPIPLKKSEYTLSHDIDALQGGWMKSFKHSLKIISVEQLYQLFKRGIQLKAPLQNLEEIILAEKKQNIQSTFFFLPVSGPTPFKNVSNADYHIEDAYVQKIFKQIKESPYHQIGLHKSIGNHTFIDELKELPSTRNRFHYLKFRIPEVYNELKESGITHDYSLGFSKQIGFRNSYGLPFKPFNPINGKSSDTWFVPLLIMDSSMHYFMGLESDESKLIAVKDFILAHRHSTIVSILWHNDYFEPKIYEELLAFIGAELTPFKEPQ